MSKYRILRRGTLYYPQFRFMWIFWLYFTHENAYDGEPYIPRFKTSEEAKQYLIENRQRPRYKFKQVVEYLE